MTGEVILTAILSLMLSFCCGWLWKGQIVTVLDKITSLFGKQFSGRNEFLQNIVFSAVLIVFAVILYFLLKKISESSSKLSKTGIILSIALILILCAVICFEQVIRRDDYWEIHDSQGYGFPNFLIFEFKNINGRYFSLLLRSMYAFFDPEQYIHIALMINILCLYLVSVYFSDTLLSFGSINHKVSHLLLCGLCLLLACLFISPNIWEVWFWGSGTFVYGVGIVFALAVLTLYLDACRGKPRYALTFFCITCGCGCSELVTASICAFGVGFILINWIIGNGKHNKALFFFSAWSFLCVAFVFHFSPSVGYASYLAGRDGTLSSNVLWDFLQQLPGLFAESVDQLCGFAYSRLEYLLFLGLIAFLLGITVQLNKIRFFPLLLFSLLMILTAVAVLTMNIFMNYVAPRVVTIPLIWLFIPTAIAFFLLGAGIHAKFKINEGCRWATALVCALMMCVPVVDLYRNHIDLLREIRVEWHQRDTLIQSLEDKSQPITVCTVPTIGSTPWDFSDDPDFEFNLVGAVYYQVPQIIGGVPCSEFFGH